MLEAVTTGLGTVIGWGGTVIDAFVGEAAALGGLLPLFAVGISTSVLFLGISVIKRVIWGA